MARLKLSKASEFRATIEKVVAMLSERGLKVTQVGINAYVTYDRDGIPIAVNIPQIPESASDDFIAAIRGFIDHEVGHVLETDGPAIVAAGIRNPRAKALANVIEDVRIERAMQKRFGGSAQHLNDLWGFVCEKQILPHARKATNDNELAAALMPSVLHAWAGKKSCQDMLDTNGFWPRLEKLTKVLEPFKERMQAGKLASTQDACDLADEMFEALRKASEPPKTEEPPPPPPSNPAEDKDEEQDKPETDEDQPEQPCEDGTPDPEQTGEGNGETDEPEDKDDPEGEDSQAEGNDASDAESESETNVENESEGDPSQDQEQAEDAAGDDKDGADDSEGAEDAADEGSAENDNSEAAGEGAEATEGDAAGEEAAEDEGAQGEDDEQAAENTGLLEGLIDSSQFKNMGSLEESFSEGAQGAVQHTLTASEYLAYTTDYDVFRKVENSDTAGVQRAAQRMDEQTDRLAGQLANHFRRLFAQQEYTVNYGGQRRGRLNAPALFKLSMGDDRVFSRREEHTATNTAVTLMIDNSGSMSGDKMDLALLSANVFSATLERVGVAHEVLGFTTHYDASMTAIDWSKIMDEQRKLRRNFSRIDPIVLPVYKEFTESYRVARLRFAAMRDGVNRSANIKLYSNVDGESIEYAARRLAARQEPRKVMIVFSDGQPAAQGDGRHLQTHLRDTVRRLNASGMETLGIGIMTADVARYYQKHCVVNDVKELPSVVMKELEKLLLK